jgi:acylphosphatase
MDNPTVEDFLLRAQVHGKVQGMYFRAFVLEKATSLNLCGYVRNLNTGQDVEVFAQGQKEQLGRLIDYLKTGPRGAEVQRVDYSFSEPAENFSGFQIKY